MKTTGTGAFRALSPPRRFRRSEAAAIIAERAPEGSPLWPYVARDLIRLARLDVDLTPELVGRMIDSAEKAYARDREVATLNSEALLSRRTVTPLTPEDVSFSRRSGAEKGKPYPEDVRGADDIRMPGVAAGDTDEVGLGDTVLPRAMPTLGAGAGRVGGVHRNDDTSGAFSR